MDAYQVLLAMAAHTARHTAQIREAEANAAFPKTSAQAQLLVVYALASGRPETLSPGELVSCPS